ncbi:hypothetical protein QYE76_028778 [Lolium multiflorum]|uniref:TF-B3 domain-containing protein n=1 Tax=Lolium multiflorum TaxID=4521 RepID=A0AAD8VHK9_LOLMU|nr:hypothetical protein QYE76_028778 [Lolium multiflorum]
MTGASAYEEQRRRIMEANQRKMDELRLHHLSAAVKDAIPKPSPVRSTRLPPPTRFRPVCFPFSDPPRFVGVPQVKSVKRKRAAPRDDAPVAVRRSDRNASNPDKPNYRYEEVYSVLDGRKKPRGRRTTSTRKDLANRVYASDEAREYATGKGEELQEKLGSDYPSFVKPLTQSHVSGGFWLGLPTDFCRKYLPKRDEFLTLVDEVDDEVESLYLALKRGLSAGWRKFSIDHELVDGDCLVFELIHRTTFKIYIIRQSSYSKKSKASKKLKA